MAATMTPLVLLVVVVIAMVTAVSVEAAPSVETRNGTFRFASYYGDHMVLQREPSGASVWGFGSPGARVVVVLYRGGAEGEGPRLLVQKHEANVSTGLGTWFVTLKPTAAGGPYFLEATELEASWGAAPGGRGLRVTLSDVLFGDVWLCGGQSNMEMTVKQVMNASWELAQAWRYPHIRLFAVALEQSTRPLTDLSRVDLPWSIPTAENLGEGDFTVFSAVCWLFGRDLQRALTSRGAATTVPVGLVQSCWGGTPVEAWSSPQALARCGLHARHARHARHAPGGYGGDDAAPAADSPGRGTLASFVGSPKAHSVLWNAMIHPLLNMSLWGVVWYQGEENTQVNPDLYNCTFPAMVDDWRSAFHAATHGATNPILPFGFAQISSSDPRSVREEYPRVRWHQSADRGYCPNSRMPGTFMAVTLDLCDRQSPYGMIHPRYKQEVASRLVRGALAVAYGTAAGTGVVFQGPFPEAAAPLHRGRRPALGLLYSQRLVRRIGGRGDFQIYCTQSDVGDLLDPTTNSSTAGKWLPAPVLLVRDYRLSLDVGACGGAVRAVRYAWADWPCELHACALYGEAPASLPAPPFLLPLSEDGTGKYGEPGR